MQETLTKMMFAGASTWTTPARRRGTVLILVMAVLGILFVTGITFMATMNFEANIIAAERQRTRVRPGLDDVLEDVDSVLATGLDTSAGTKITSALLGTSTASFGEMPGVHNLFAPIEPYENPNILGQYLFRSFTELASLKSDSFTGSEFRGVGIDTSWAAGKVLIDPNFIFGPAGSFVPLDADGDGIVDSIQIDLSALGVDSAQVAELARSVNPIGSPRGKIFLGLRMIAHGGMVNVNESHPLLIGNILGDLTRHNPPYSPLVEEASLRRRNFLPPRELPPTRLQGNPLVPDPEAGNGDFSNELFPPGQTLWDHRFWTFASNPGEFTIDGERPDWVLRMNPIGATYTPDQYDRRHLVTTVSHDDLLARQTKFEWADDLSGKAETLSRDVIDLVRDLGCDAVDRFPLVNYPETLANTHSGPKDGGFDTFDWCLCITSSRCELNPRKGKLRLSLPWLDDNLDWFIPDQKLRMIRLIQDAFTLVLLNARGSEWGFYQLVDLNGDGTPNMDVDGDGTKESFKQVWIHEFDAISRAAASLTANMIDFADFDDEPTAVTLRIADPLDAAFGLPVLGGEEVFGLERQPFITEVVALPVDDVLAPGTPDPAASFYGVELFNPYEFNSIILEGTYRLSMRDASGGIRIVELTGTIPPRGFATYYTGTLMPLPDGTLVGNIQFAKSSTVNLVRVLSDGTTVVVDQFSLAGSDVGDLPLPPLLGTLGSVERETRVSAGQVHWYAPIPVGAADSEKTETHTLGFGNVYAGHSGGDDPPVEVELANSGSLSSAFPTTGSLLLLMRHANSGSEAFTSFLNVNPEQIDNGRMPIFDLNMLHHIDPSKNETVTPAAETRNRAGDLAHLPWGQLVFDYFTALPLDSPGTVAEPNRHLPRVDLDGLRVHGRVNLNAAPWTVLAGLPLLPINAFAEPFRSRFKVFLKATGFPLGSDDEATPIGKDLAKAIVAYRDTTEFTDTGNYDESATSLDPDGRGWKMDKPTWRRGTGFMSVGELANVRHLDATDDFRIDRGEIDVPASPYINAVTMLAMMGDWMTVRSQVFTVYGVLRGQEDETIEDIDPVKQLELRLDDVDSRAIRFQETVDRLPIVLGKPMARVGDRVVAKYNDTRSD